MKTNQLFLIAAALGFATISQAQTQDNVKGLKWEAHTTNLELVTINPEQPAQVQSSKQIKLASDKKYMPNTMTYVKEHNSIYFFTQSHMALMRGFAQGQQLEVANAETGKIVRSLPIFNTTFMAPFIIPGSNQLGFIATERGHNGYGNNEDNIALVIFDMNNGEMAHRIELPSISMSATATPFVGNAKTQNPNGFNTIDAEVSVSSPCYIPTTNTLLIAAKDVMGVNRLYRIDLQQGKLISKLTLGVDILDMTFDAEANVVHTLYISEENTVRSLVVGEMSLSGVLSSNKAVVRNITEAEENITDGEIEFDADTKLLTVVKTADAKQVFYTFDADYTLKSEDERSTTTGNVDVEYSTPVVTPGRIDFDNLIKMYPNPAQEELTIETEQLTKVNRIRVFDNVGQEVKDVDVQSNELLNTINISTLKPGLYMVEIESSGATTVTKKLVVQ